MDDLSRAWAILNLPPGSSADAVRSSYRELVKSWHPDRFQSDADRLDEAHEMLKEINWAYNYLRDTVLKNETLTDIVAAPPSETPSSAEPDEQIETPLKEAASG